MILKIQQIVIFITIFSTISCKNEKVGLTEIEGKQIPIDSTLAVVDSIDTFITPYRDRLNSVLDSTLAIAKWPISRDEGRYNSPAGNLIADLILSEANPVFTSRTGNEIDFALMNFGGIRAVISEGKVTARNAFEVMPFENSIVVVALKGTTVLKMVSYLKKSTRPHPISGIQIVLDRDGNTKSVTVKGKPLDEGRTYYVATSNYLVTGGDHMDFFQEALSVTDTDYLIRNAMIDYFKKVDTLAPIIDDRFYKMK